MFNESCAAIDIVTAFVESRQGSLRKINLRDPNVPLSRTSQSPKVQPLTVEGKVIVSSRELIVRAGNESIALITRGQFITRQAVSVNRPDVVIPTKQIYGLMTHQGMKMYSGTGSLEGSLRKCLLDPPLAHYLEQAKFQETSSLHLYRNELILYSATPSDLLALTTLANIFVSIAACLISTNRPENARLRLPRDLEALRPLMTKWSISDDDEREQVIQASSRDEVVAFCAAVEPYLNRLSMYLGEHDDDDLQTPAKISALLETALEARSYLRILQ